MSCHIVNRYFSLTFVFIARISAAMDTKPLMDALRQRAFDARLPLYKLCEQAKVSPAVFTRSNQGATTSMRALSALEKAMTHIEENPA